MKKTFNVFLISLISLNFFIGIQSFALTPDPIENYRLSAGKIEFFAVGKPSMLKVHGTGKSLDGSLNKNNDEVTGHFTVKMDDFSSGLSLRDSHTKSKVFDVEHFPTAEFTLKSIKPKSNVKTKFVGVLKFHGIEKEVQGDTTMNITPDKMGFESTFTILLSDFNIQPPEFAGMKINNEVSVEVSGEAAK